LSWLEEKIKECLNKGIKYFIFDSPGQIEIFTLSESFKNIIKYLTNPKELNLRLCVVNLIESNNILDIPRYIFSIFSVLNSMINLELPQINLISKIDLLKQFYEKEKESSDKILNFPLNIYKNPLNSDKFKEALDDYNINKKFKNLNKLIVEYVIDFGLVSFDILDVKNQKLLNKASALIDKANGYIYFDTGKLEDEQYIEIRNEIAKNDLEFEDDDEEYL
jgi:hypothetical protein